MKKIYTPIVCLLFFQFLSCQAHAQSNIAFDTIRLVQDNFFRQEYGLNDTIINSIKIETRNAKLVQKVHFKFGSDVAKGMLTSITGIGLSDAKDVDWYLASTIQTNNPKLDWISDIYCPGYIEKERQRVRNNDGSYSVESHEVNHYLWENGALAYIIEASDTVGWHYVYRNPRSDTTLARWTPQVYTKQSSFAAFNSFDFALLGQFTGKESAIFYNFDQGRIYVFSEDELWGILQFPKQSQWSMNKKKRNSHQPYLLANSNLSAWERMDVLRLSMVGMRIKLAIEKSITEQ
ncbi:MAG: hypothetical protein WCI92_17385 [Bacteroidota bacterium]